MLVLPQLHVIRSGVLIALLGVSAVAQGAFPVAAHELGAGPILTLARNLSKGGAFVEQEVWLLDPSGEDPQPWLAFRAPCNVEFAGRIDRQRFLVQIRQGPEGLFVVDSAAGTARRLLDRHASIARVLRVANGFVDLHSELPIGIDADHSARGLLRVPVDDVAHTKELFGSGGRVVAVEATATWVLDSVAGVRLFRVTGEGEPEMVFDLGMASLSVGLPFELAPDGRCFALGRPRPSGAWALSVVDIASGTVIAEIGNLRCEVAAWSSQSPSPAFAWLGSGVLRFSRSVGADPVDPHCEWVDWDIATDREIAVHERGAVGLRHERPSVAAPPFVESTAPHREGRFVRDTHRVWFLGEKEPAIDMRDAQHPDRRVAQSELVFAPGATFAAALPRGSPNELVVLDGETSRRIVRTGSGFHSLSWLPAAR